MTDTVTFLHDGDSVHQINNRIHVNPAGDDNQSGSPYFPKGNLYSAVNNAQDGTHIIAEHGVHNFYGSLTNRNGIYITGQGQTILQGSPSMTDSEHIWFKDLIFFPISGSTTGFNQCGDIHFERCSISGEDSRIVFQNPTGSLYFDDCELSCKIQVYGNDIPANGYKLVINNNKSDKCEVLMFNTDIVVHIRNSIIEKVENISNTGKLEPEEIHIDSLSHDGQYRDIPIVGHVKVIEHETERMRNLYGRHELIISDYVHPASCKNAFYIVDASAGSVTIDLSVEGVAPGSRVLLVDTNAGTWDDGSHIVSFRWPNGSGGYNFVRYTTARDYGEAIFDGTTWRTF